VIKIVRFINIEKIIFEMGVNKLFTGMDMERGIWAPPSTIRKPRKSKKLELIVLLSKGILTEEADSNYGPEISEFEKNGIAEIDKLSDKYVLTSKGKTFYKEVLEYVNRGLKEAK